MPSPPPTDASSNNSTNSTGEVVDRSDEFVDNRNDVCDPPADIIGLDWNGPQGIAYKGGILVTRRVARR